MHAVEPGQSWINRVVVKTFNHSVVYGLSVGLLPLTSLILLPIYTRTLSIEAFGQLSLLMVTSGILSFLYDLGMINALFRRYFDHDAGQSHERRVVLSSAGVFLAAHAALWTIVLILLAPGVPAIRTQGLMQIVQVMLIGTLLTSCTDVPMAVLRIRGRLRAFVFISALRSGGLVALTWLLIARYHMGLIGVFASQILVSAMVVVVLAALTYREFTPRVSWTELKAMAKFGLPFFPVLFFTWIIDFSDRYFLGALSTLQEVGVYTVSYKLGQLVLLVVKAFMVAWIPLMFSIAKHADAPRAFAKVFRYYLLGLCVLALGIALWAPELVGLMATSAYQRGSGVVPLVVAAYVCYGVYSFMLSGLLVTKDVRVQPLTLAAASILNAALNWWWIPSMGMWGAAWATLVSYAAAAAVTWAAAQRRYPLPIDVGAMAGMVGVAGAWCLLAYGLHVPPIGKGLLFLSYIPALYVIGAFRPTELQQIVGERGGNHSREVQVVVASEVTS